jgi:hypothetical protein
MSKHQIERNVATGEWFCINAFAGRITFQKQDAEIQLKRIRVYSTSAVAQLWNRMEKRETR